MAITSSMKLRLFQHTYAVAAILALTAIVDSRYFAPNLPSGSKGGVNALRVRHSAAHRAALAQRVLQQQEAGNNNDNDDVAISQLQSDILHSLGMNKPPNITSLSSDNVSEFALRQLQHNTDSEESASSEEEEEDDHFMARSSKLLLIAKKGEHMDLI